jgi:hypothetical protein
MTTGRTALETFQISAKIHASQELGLTEIHATYHPILDIQQYN